MHRSIALVFMGLFTGVIFGLAITSRPDYWIPFSMLFLLTICYTAIYSWQEKTKEEKLSKLEGELENAMHVIYALVKEEPEATPDTDKETEEGESI